MDHFLQETVDLTQPSFWVAAGMIAFNPTFWNIAARTEYHHQTISSLIPTSLTQRTSNPTHTRRLYGCYLLAITIFSLGLFRDMLYERALRDQPVYPALLEPPAQIFAYLLLGMGNVLVLSSMWALGITGTYLGDYFGILMDQMVTGFPFNVTDAPMYYGSTMSFLGSALLYGRPAGIVLSLEVLVAYLVALRFEDPFTAEIYAKRDRERKATGSKAQ